MFYDNKHHAVSLHLVNLTYIAADHVYNIIELVVIKVWEGWPRTAYSLLQLKLMIQPLAISARKLSSGI